MLNWAQKFNIFCYLDTQQYTSENGYECLLAAGVESSIDSSASFYEINEFASGKWCFGHLSYSLKDIFYPSSLSRKDIIGFPSFFFFQPQVLIQISNSNSECTIWAAEPDVVYNDVVAFPVDKPVLHSSVHLTQRLSKEDYITRIEKLQQHILKGDCYEINFCMEFFAENSVLDPVSVFQKLVATSPTPYSAMYRLNDKFLLCASPERFLKRSGSRILSQPMKGTSKRNVEDKVADEQLIQTLQNDQKERAENVMVVDLVRNDLSKICKEATVNVDELFGVYTFPQVHQMVSTVSGELKQDVCFSEIIQATFPMGSMTGAPKHRVMQLIEEYEPVGRGLFSGSVGYINPQGDFDFNVVIRSIQYNASQKCVFYSAGSGITFYSDAEKEGEECLLKGSAIKKVLTES